MNLLLTIIYTNLEPERVTNLDAFWERLHFNKKNSF